MYGFLSAPVLVPLAWGLALLILQPHSAKARNLWVMAAVLSTAVLSVAAIALNWV